MFEVFGLAVARYRYSWNKHAMSVLYTFSLSLNSIFKCSTLPQEIQILGK